MKSDGRFFALFVIRQASMETMPFSLVDGFDL